MTFKEYQKAARKTAIYPIHVYDGFAKNAIEYNAMALGAETGEIQGKLSKVMRGDVPLVSIIPDMKKEMGDCLWHLTMLAHELGLNMNDIAEYNLYKLDDRKKRGVLRGDGDQR